MKARPLSNPFHVESDPNRDTSKDDKDLEDFFNPLSNPHPSVDKSSPQLGGRAPARVLPERTRTTRGAVPKTTVEIKWKVNITKVATTNGPNSQFPHLSRTRTGWTAGRLIAYDAKAIKPYVIGWTSIPKLSDAVTYKEMEVLVRQYKQAEKRKVIDWFCTGMDLLWKVPRSTNPGNLRWVTVMFWDAQTERYKILFRDGKDAWVTGEAIDEAIAFNSTHSDLDRAEAAKEKWSPAVTATLLQYGMYTAKNVGPSSFPNSQAGTAMLNGVELQPQRFPVATTDAP